MNKNTIWKYSVWQIYQAGTTYPDGSRYVDYCVSKHRTLKSAEKQLNRLVSRYAPSTYEIKAEAKASLERADHHARAIRSNMSTKE